MYYSTDKPSQGNTCIILPICPDKEIHVSFYRYARTKTFMCHSTDMFRQGNARTNVLNILTYPDKEIHVSHYRYSQTTKCMYMCLATDIPVQGNTCVTLSMCTGKCMYACLATDMPRQGKMYVCLATDIPRHGHTYVTLSICADKEIYTCVWLPMCLDKEIHMPHYRYV